MCLILWKSINRNDFTVTVRWAVVESDQKRWMSQSLYPRSAECYFSVADLKTLISLCDVTTYSDPGDICLDWKRKLCHAYFLCFLFFLQKKNICAQCFVNDCNEESYLNPDLIIWSFSQFQIGIPFSYAFVFKLSALVVLCTGFCLFTDHTPNYMRVSVKKS